MTRRAAHPGTARAESAEIFEQQLFLRLVRASEHVMYRLGALLKEHGLTEAQYNALRILRGAEGGLPCQGIADRMLTRVPDITRLVDRLESAGSVRRERGTPTDRRVVIVHVTRQGRRLLSRLDAPILELHREQFRHLDPTEIAELTRLLSKFLEE